MANHKNLGPYLIILHHTSPVFKQRNAPLYKNVSSFGTGDIVGIRYLCIVQVFVDTSCWRLSEKRHLRCTLSFLPTSYLILYQWRVRLEITYTTTSHQGAIYMKSQWFKLFHLFTKRCCMFLTSLLFYYSLEKDTPPSIDASLPYTLIFSNFSNSAQPVAGLSFQINGSFLYLI